MTSSARLALILVGVASFIIMGAGQSVFGPALPSYERTFSVSTAATGWLISSFWIGCFASVTGMYFLGDRPSPRAGLTAILLGSALLAAAPMWNLTLLGSFIFGLGYGCLTAIFNPRILAAFGARGPSMLSLVNAAFSIGAIASPLIFVWLGSDPKLVFWTLAALAAVCFAAAGPAGRAKAARKPRQRGRSRRAARSTGGKLTISWRLVATMRSRMSAARCPPIFAAVRLKARICQAP